MKCTKRKSDVGLIPIEIAAPRVGNKAMQAFFYARGVGVVERRTSP